MSWSFCCNLSLKFPLTPVQTSIPGLTFFYTVKARHLRMMDSHSPPRLALPFAVTMSRSYTRTPRLIEADDDWNISLQEWQGWGSNSPFPVGVAEAIQYLKSIEREADVRINFDGYSGTLGGDFKIHEDKKHRAIYKALNDSEKKIQFFSARQIACRLLGSRGYLCQKCWLVREDCICSRVITCSLPNWIRLWVYMHPKDFLRQNNTGKLLWQVFGTEAATLCLYGITEHENTMWNEFQRAGKNKVFCLYPNKNAVPKSVNDYFTPDSSSNLHGLLNVTNGNEVLNFVLIDGTWSNSGAIFHRLKDNAKSAWGNSDLNCISLATGASAMHKLRPQPSFDRTCTAAAAVSLLDVLQLVPGFCSHSLNEKAEALEDALLALLEVLTARRVRKGSA